MFLFCDFLASMAVSGVCNGDVSNEAPLSFSLFFFQSIPLVIFIFIYFAGFSAGQECVTGDVCHNVTHNVTVGNTTYCCSDVTLRPTTKNNSCACLSANTRMKNWADETMGEGKIH